MTSTYTVTSALPYANGPIHIGHLAGAFLPADIYVRYLRSKGKRVLYIGGSDEHGVPITIKAKQEGITPQQVVDKYHLLNKNALGDFGISFDIFSRTSSKVHYQVASDFFKKLHSDGAFELHETEQHYDVENEQFLADRYIKGTCPSCSYDSAYGDQCESCGTTLSPKELINPKSALSGNVPILKKTEHWYLPLNKYEDWLKKWILEDHKEWKQTVYGQCKSWLDQGLKPRAVTRDLDWGVPVPLKDANGKVLYVWFDAPIGYISATIEWAKENNQNWEPFWKSPDTKLIQFLGKDNIVFHCIIFPAMLRAHGDFILPDNIPANEFLNIEGRKISTSRNWAVWLHEYLIDFPDKQDILRYVLCANAPEGRDSDFSWKDFQARNNNELVAVLGNFINRVFVLVHKYFDGAVPHQGEKVGIDQDLVINIKRISEEVDLCISTFKFKEGLQLCMELARAGNKYLADTEPWKLIKEDKERVGTILNISLQLIANLAILIEPFMPDLSLKLFKMLYGNHATTPGATKCADFTSKSNNPGIIPSSWDCVGSINLVPTNIVLQEPFLLFDKIDDEAIEKQNCKLRGEV